MGIQSQLVDLRRAEDIEPAFHAAIAQRAEALSSWVLMPSWRSVFRCAIGFPASITTHRGFIRLTYVSVVEVKAEWFSLGASRL